MKSMKLIDQLHKARLSEFIKLDEILPKTDKFCMTSHDLACGQPHRLAIEAEICVYYLLG